MTDRLGEALTIHDRHRRLGQGTPKASSQRIVEAARDHLTCLRDWITCPTCNGSGDWRIITSTFDGWEPCPDCVNGQQPSPELIERVAIVLHDNDGAAAPPYWSDCDDGMRAFYRNQSTAALLASRQGDTQ